MNRQLARYMNQMIFMGPAIFFYALIMLTPLVLSLYYSMTDWNGVSNAYSWVGLQNYLTIFTEDADFAHSFWFTARITLVITVLTNVIGFLLAFVLMQKLRFRNLWRTIFFVPNVMGGLLLGFIWQFIFVQGFPKIGEITGLSIFNVLWLGTEATAFWGIVIVSVWQGVGYVMVIYVAGLSGVPSELKEAARIDGANGLMMMTRVILPLIMSSITVCLFWTINNTFKIFDLNYSLTNGGPFKSSESVALNIYLEAFRNNNFGLGTAKAVIFFMAVGVVASIQVYLTKRKEVEA